MDLTTAAPVDFDTHVAALYADLYAKQAGSDRAWDSVVSSVKSMLSLKWNERPTLAEIQQTLAEIEEIPKGDRNYAQDGAWRSWEDYQNLQDQIAGIYSDISAADEIYRERGSWNRAYLVTNVGGHVHRTMSCSTTYTTTQFHWVVAFSDHSEDEIVAAAGERACTVCYPTAPVGVKGTSMFTPDEIAKQKNREEREAKRAERDAAKVTLNLWNQVATEKVYDETGRYTWKREVVLTDVTWKTTRALQNDAGALIRNIYGSWSIINGFEYNPLTQQQAQYNLEQMLYALDERGVNITEFQAKQIKRAEKEG